MINLIAVIMVFVSTLLSSFGSLMIKKGSKKEAIEKKIKKNKISIRKEWIIGIIFHAVSTIIFVSSLKLGEVSILYPITSLSYIWVCFLSAKILKEKIDSKKFFGIGLIILGVIIITV